MAPEVLNQVMEVEPVEVEPVEPVETQFFSTLEATAVQASQVQSLGRQLITAAVVVVESMKITIHIVV
jgi:hypothetical protein